MERIEAAVRSSAAAASGCPRRRHFRIRRSPFFACIPKRWRSVVRPSRIVGVTAVPSNKQLQPTVIPNRMRAASVSCH